MNIFVSRRPVEGSPSASSRDRARVPRAAPPAPRRAPRPPRRAAASVTRSFILRSGVGNRSSTPGPRGPGTCTACAKHVHTACAHTACTHSMCTMWTCVVRSYPLESAHCSTPYADSSYGFIIAPGATRQSRPRGRVSRCGALGTHHTIDLWSRRRHRRRATRSARG